MADAVRDALALLAHAVADELPRGGQVTVRSTEGEYELDAWVTCRLPVLRFWRRGQVRAKCIAAAERALVARAPAHVLVRVRWGD